MSHFQVCFSLSLRVLPSHSTLNEPKVDNTLRIPSFCLSPPSRPLPSPACKHLWQTLPSTPTRPCGDAGPTSSPSKRRYVPDAADVEVVKKFHQSEVELCDRNTILCGIKNVIFYVLSYGITHANTLVELSSVRNTYVTKLKDLKVAKKTGAAAPVATQLSGIHYYHCKQSLIVSSLPDSKLQARKQSVCPHSCTPRSLLRHSMQRTCIPLS